MSAVAPVPRSSPLKELPLSRAQESMWFLCRLAQDSAVYNLPAAVRLRGPLDIPSLRAGFEAIVARHEILRTVFPGAEGKPRQEVRPAIDLPLELVDCSDLPAEEGEAYVRELAREAGRRPFDLSGGPLFRLVLYRFSDQEHVLLTVFHHLVWDGWSIGVFVTELAVQYEAARRGENADLPELPIQYADFALWERTWLEQKLESRLRYWRAALQDHAALELTPDRRRPPVQTYEGRTLPIQLPAEVASAAERVSRDAETTPYMTLLAGFAALLQRWACQERFTLGTPVANRHHREVAPLIGFFANLLPVPLDLSGAPSFAEVLRRTKASATSAFANQDIPFDALVEGLGAGGDPSRNPILQVIFALHQESLDTITLGDVAVEPVVLESDTTHFDLALHLWRRAGGVQGYFAYNSDLYDPSTVARLGRSLITFLRAALDDPDAPISSLPLVGDAERSRLHSMQDLQDVEVPGSMVDALARQAVGGPDRGVWSEAGSLSLAGLRTRAEALANTLVERGAGPGARLGFVMEDPATLIVATWAAWLTRSVPVPLDPGAPDAHHREILAGVNARLILRDGDGGVPVVGSLDEAEAPSRPAPGREVEPTPFETLPLDGPTLDDTAYVSEAADPPVEVTHRQVAERIKRLQGRVPLGPDDVVFGLSGATPDMFLVGCLWPLAVGSLLTTAPEEATVLVATPTDLRRFLAGKPTRPARLHTLLCSGGYLEAELAERARALLGCKVIYLYAPPEVGGEVGIERIEAGANGGRLSRAGRPILPTRVLDENRALIPVGVPGRVWVGDRPTRDRGRWREDGSLELLGPVPGWLWRDGSRHRLDRVHRAVLSDRSVLGCHVIARGDHLCAYVVTSGMAPASRIARALPLPRSLRPKVLPVSHLPIDSDGRVDEAALMRLPIVDEDLAEAWEEAIRTRAGVEKAKVVVRDAEQERTHVHLDDLVPGWRRRRTADRTSSTDHAELAPSFSAPIPPSSYCRGEELLIPEGAPATLVDALRQAASRWGDDRGLTVYETAMDETFLSYAELLDRARRVAAGLHARGLRGGGRVILQIERLADHFVALWGCILAGVAPVAVARAPSYDDKNAVLTKLWNTWTLLGEPPILASSSLCASLRGAGALFGSTWEPIRFDDLETSATNPVASTADPEDVVFIQLTSGSTGVPKAVPETHRAVIAHVLAARQMNDYTESDVGLNWLSLDHVVPLLTCHLKDTYLGLPQIHVRTQAVLTDPLLWLDLIEKHRVTLSWAPNFAFKLVNDAMAEAGGRSWDLSSLRWVMNAGEQVTLPVSSAWVRNLASFGVRSEVLQPAYGMAELATAITYANDFSPGTAARTVRKDSLGGVLADAPEPGPDAITFVDVGPPIPGVELRIATGGGETLPESVIGRVQARGAVTMPGYINNPDANAEAFVGDGWFDTGDLGYIHGGRLSITGRTKEMIIVRGANFYCYEIEEVVNNSRGVLSTFAAVCAMDDPKTGTESMAVFFVPDGPGEAAVAASLQSIQENITREFGVTPAYVIPVARDAFPKTTSGKIQRTQLKKRLAAGEFDDLLRRIDLATGKNTLPAWFLEWSWRPSRPGLTRRSPQGTTLVVDARASAGFDETPMDHDLRAAGLVEALADDGAVLVEVGEGFVEHGSTHFSVKPEDVGHLDRVVQEVLRRARAIDAVFAVNPSPGTLLALGRALATVGSVRLVVGVTHALKVRDTDRPVPERAALRGLTETIPAEWHDIDVSLVDVTGEVDGAARLVAESRIADKARTVAYREGDRLVPVLQEARFSSGGDSLAEGDLVVVTGGLGGVGGELCKHLMIQHRVRLVVTGRSSLDTTEDEGPSEGLGRQKTTTERRATLAELEALGEVLYRRADVTDRASMERAVAEAEERFGTRLRAAVHLAGIFPPRLLGEETPASLAATLSPKLDGARCLDDLVPDDGLIVLFGSVYGTFGAAACGGYAVANAALAGFAASRSGPTRLVDWSNWDDLGMSRGYTLMDSSKALGFDMIGRRSGLDSFDAALHAESPTVLVGLDVRRPNVSRYLTGAPRGLQELVAFHTPPSDPTALAGLQVFDVAGHPTRCSFVPVIEMPLDGAGAVDLSRLDAVCRSQSPQAILPRTSAERTVAAIWQEILEIDRIDIDANFFSLGGQSILLLQVLERLEKSFGRRIAVVDLFRYPTVRTLADFLGGSGAEKRSYEDAADRARKQRRARRARSRTRGPR